MKRVEKRPRQNNKMPGLGVRLTAANMLTKVVDEKASIETLCDPYRGFKEFTELDGRDQALAKAILLTTLRHKTRIEAMLKKCWNRKPPQKARFLIHMMETAAAQIVFMDAPESAAVNTAVTGVRNDKRTTRFASFTNAVLRTLSRDKEKLLEATSNVSVFPNWMRKTLATDFGKEKSAEIGKAILFEPTIDLQAKSELVELEDLTLQLPLNAKRLNTTIPVNELPGFDKGEWWVQDIAAALPARLLKDISGKKVADLCAAPGGKTMQLASLGAHVTAVDISKRRIKRLEENLNRTGLNAEIIQTDILTWEPGEIFDAVLLDAPCSATGTLRRHPDILWNTEQGDVDLLVELQKQLITKAISFLKPGGVLVYANCSLLKQEGENLIAKSHFGGLRFDPIEPEKLGELGYCVTGQGIYRALPHYLKLQPEEKSGMDGFFAARYIKEG